MKFIKLTWAEIKKIIFRPAFYIMVGCLFVAIIVSAFIFSPAERSAYTSQISGSSITVMHNNFNSGNSSIIDSKEYLQNELNEEFDKATNFNNQSNHQELVSRVSVIFKSYFYNLETAIENAQYTTKLLTDIYDESSSLLQYFDSIKNSSQPVNYLFKSKDFENFSALLRNIRASLPSTKEDINNLQNDRNALITKVKLIWTSYKAEVDNMIKVCESIQKIEFDEQFLKDIQEFKIYANAMLAVQAAELEKYYNQNIAYDNDRTQVLEFRAMLNDYKATVETSKIVINNMINIEKLKYKSGNENSYLGFEEISVYKLKEETAFYKYAITNRIPYSKAMTALNFQQNSHLKTNCYDFAYYLMAVSSLMLTIIMIYLASLSFAGEKHDGLMRMNITKPCSRTKLYFAKISALLAISFVAHLALGLIFLAIGACIYGASGATLIAVFSGSKAFAVAPFWNFIYKIFSLFIANGFYIIIACFISILFSNPVFSVVISYLVYIFALLTNTLLAKTAFVKFLPFIHAEHSFFFGGGSWSNAFLSNLIYSGASYALSLCYLIAFIAILITASTQIFKRQDL